MTLHEKEDSKYLLRRLSESDREAFARLFAVYHPKVNAFAYKLTHSEALAEEIVQDVFMKIWLNRESLAAVEHFQSYLYTIARNHTFNILKRLAREENARAAFGRELSQHHESEESSMQEERQQLLNQAVDRLPPQQRLVYSLCHQKGLKYEEAARQLNISRLTVKAHMQQALRSIRSHFSSTYSVLMLILLGIGH